jgi:hypothetical protein
MGPDQGRAEHELSSNTQAWAEAEKAESVTVRKGR